MIIGLQAADLIRKMLGSFALAWKPRTIHLKMPCEEFGGGHCGPPTFAAHYWVNGSDTFKAKRGARSALRREIEGAICRHVPTGRRMWPSSA